MSCEARYQRLQRMPWNFRPNPIWFKREEL